MFDAFSLPIVPAEYTHTFPELTPTVAFILQLLIVLLLLPPATLEVLKNITPFVAFAVPSILQYLMVLFAAPLIKVKAVPVAIAVLVFLKVR